MIDVAVIELCAPQIAVETIQRVIAVESAGDPYAINVNGVGRVRAGSGVAAISIAQRLIEEGYSVDLGLMQINSRHLTELKLTVAQAFEPCANLRAGAQILQGAYQKAAGIFGPGQRALQAAFSTYNTGNATRGLANGYVSSLYGARLETGAAAAARAPETYSAYSAPTMVFAAQGEKP